MEINYEKIISQLLGNVYCKNEKLHYVWCNDNFAKILKLPHPSHISGKTDHDFLSKELADSLRTTDLLVINEKKSVSCEEFGIDADGNHAIYFSLKSPLLDNANNVVGLLGISIDITEHKKAEEGLRADKEQAELTLNSIIANLPAHVYWKDINGVYLGSNDQQAKSLGLKCGAEIVGKTDFDLPWSKKDAAIFRENDLEVIHTNKAKITEEPATVDGKTAIVLSQKVPLHNKKGEVIGVLGISTDITIQKQAEKALKLAKEQAEAADLKTEFILNMEHDLRTPAGGIKGLLEIMVRKETDPERKRKLQLIWNSSNELLNILSEILKFRQIESGCFPVLEKKFYLECLVNSAVSLETAAAEDKELKIITHYDSKIPKELMGDDFRVQKILINLIGNAVKFTKEGEVTVSVTLLKQKTREATIEIKVADTGIGIPEDKRSIIYEKFVKLDLSNRRGSYRGTGLGLYIVKQFISDMGGEIELVSEVGKGSTFTCTLPFKISLAKS